MLHPRWVQKCGRERRCVQLHRTRHCNFNNICGHHRCKENSNSKVTHFPLQNTSKHDHFHFSYLFVNLVHYDKGAVSGKSSRLQWLKCRYGTCFDGLINHSVDNHHRVCHNWQMANTHCKNIVQLWRTLEVQENLQWVSHLKSNLLIYRELLSPPFTILRGTMMMRMMKSRRGSKKREATGMPFWRWATTAKCRQE